MFSAFHGPALEHLQRVRDDLLKPLPALRDRARAAGKVDDQAPPADPRDPPGKNGGRFLPVSGEPEHLGDPRDFLLDHLRRRFRSDVPGTQSRPAGGEDKIEPFPVDEIDQDGLEPFPFVRDDDDLRRLPSRPFDELFQERTAGVLPFPAGCLVAQDDNADTDSHLNFGF